MAVLSTSACHVRSISLPPISHPTALQVVEALHAARSRSAYESMRSGLASLEELFEAVNRSLGLASSQRAVSLNKSERVLDELLDASVGLLDACATTREALSWIREHRQSIRSGIRRSYSDSIQAEAAAVEKKSRKDVRRAVAGLKQIENKFALKDSSPLGTGHEHDPRFGSMVVALREAYVMVALVLRAILSRLASEKKCNKRFSLFKLTASSEDKQDQLDYLEMGNIEKDLDSLYRKLIRTRALLLNIFSL